MDHRSPINIDQLVQEYISSFPTSVHVNGVFLFGSFARGDMHEDSDVDLVVLSEDFAQMPFIKRLEFLSKMRRAPITRSVPMDIFGYTPEEFADLDKESAIMKKAKQEGRFVWKRSE